MTKMIINTNNICPVLGDKFNDLVNKGNVRIGLCNQPKELLRNNIIQELIANDLFMRKHVRYSQTPFGLVMIPSQGRHSHHLIL